MPQNVVPGDGQWADQQAINANADELGAVENQVAALRRDVLRLRSMYMGLVEVVRTKLAFDQAELDRHVKDAWTMIAAHEPGDTATATSPDAAPVGHGRLLTCSKCKRQVPASRITLLPSGEICDSCANR